MSDSTLSHLLRTVNTYSNILSRRETEGVVSRTMTTRTKQQGRQCGILQVEVDSQPAVERGLAQRQVLVP